MPRWLGVLFSSFASSGRNLPGIMSCGQLRPSSSSVPEADTERRARLSRLRLPPVRVYLVMSFVSQMAFLTVATVSIVYQITQANLDPFQLLIVGTVLEATVFIFEIPTGVVADVYSRKLSLLIGFALIGVGFIILGAFPLFWTILISQVVWGMGYTFTSGARQAWLSDELGDDDETSRTFVRGARFELAGSLVGIGLSVALASVFVSLSLFVGGAMFLVLVAVLTAIMPEDTPWGTPELGLADLHPSQWTARGERQPGTHCPDSDRTLLRYVQRTVRQALGQEYAGQLHLPRVG